MTGVVAFAVLALTLVLRRDPAAAMVSLDVAALGAERGDERWSGIFFEQSHVGYSVSRTSRSPDGRALYEQRSQFQVASMGQLQKVVTASAALVDAEGRLNRFDFFLASNEVRLSARGEVVGNEIKIEVLQGETSSTLSFPVERPPHVSLSLEEVVRRTPLSMGARIEVPWFDPLTMTEDQMTLVVTGVEVLENGEEAYWLTSRVRDLETHALMLPTGETLRQEGALGLSIVRMTEEAARAIPNEDEPVDLISLSAVQLVGDLPSARTSRVLSVRVQGVDPARVPLTPPTQTLAGDVLTISRPIAEELPPLPVRDDSDPSWLEATPSLPATHPDILSRARELTGGATDRWTATTRLVDWVYGYVEKVPTMGVPNGLEVLRTARGDCNEHTALFVTLARAAGIPSRIAAGVVYTDRLGPKGAFYYHAWPEVKMGDLWVPVDPTFGQHIADATHIKLVEGDLDRQVEIMGYLGRLKLELVEAR